MNQRVEKLEGILEKQQSFLNQFLQSLQEIKPSDENWSDTLKSLQNHLEKITFRKNIDTIPGEAEDQEKTSISSTNIQKELEEFKKRDEENQKIISSYDAKIKNLQHSLSNLTIQFTKMTNQQNNLSLDSNVNDIKPVELSFDGSDTNVAINEIKKVVNTHTTQISAILDSPAFSLPSDVDVKIHEFDTDLHSIKTMLRNQADIWSEFEATIQVLVQYKDETNESSGSEDHKGTTDNSKRETPHSQYLQEQIRCLKYEVKKVRQEISAYSDQQDAMSRDKGLDMPNRFNKINNQLGDLRKSINDSNNKIDALSEKVSDTKPIIKEHKIITPEKISDSLSCIKHELKNNIKKVNILFQSIKQIQNDISNIQSKQKTNNETINQLRQVFDPDDESSQSESNNHNNNSNSIESPSSLKTQFKQIVEQANNAQAKSIKHDQIFESLTQKINDITKNIKILTTLKQPIKALQESNENNKRDIDRIKQQLQINPSTTERDIKIIQNGSNTVENRSNGVEVSIPKQIQIIQNELNQLRESQQKIEEDIQNKFKDIQNPKHVIIDNNSGNTTNNGNTNSITSLLNARRERSNSNASGLNLHLSGLSSSNGIPLTGQSSSSQSRDLFFNFNRNNNNNNNNNNDGGNNTSNETDADIDFDDLSPPSTPIIIKSTFESVDDITDAFKLVTHEQNRQKKVVERLVDAIKQAEIKNNKLKYLDKMMQEMRNRSSEQGDMLLAIKSKQATQEKTLTQLTKTVRYIETLNISNELEAIKKHLKNSNYHPPAEISPRNPSRSPIRTHASQPMQQYDDLRYPPPPEQKTKKTKTGTSSVRNTQHSRKDPK